MRASGPLAAALALLVVLLAACGADDEPSNRSSSAAAATTTTRPAVAATTAAPATTTPAAVDASASLSGETAATPGVSGHGATNAQDVACANATGIQQHVVGATGAAVTTTTPGGVTTTTPDGVTTTTPDGVTTTTPTGATTTTPDGVATTTPTGVTTTTPDGVATTTPADETSTELDPTTTPAGTTTPAVAPATELEATTGTAAGDDVAHDQAVLARPFSSTSPWNTPIDTRVVDPRSAGWIEQASRRVAVVASQNRRSVTTAERAAQDLRLYVNTCAWTPTIVGEDGGETVRVVCRQRNCGEVAKQIRTVRVPTGVDPFPEFDGWYSVIDESARVGYDMWRARRVGDVISYQFIKRWALNGPGYSAPATEDASAAVGARGSGLPLFAGVIQPSELRQGRIDHALAISVPGPAQRIFVPPASVTNGININTSLPEGARLRLKSTFKLGDLSRGANRRSAEAIVTALRTYGAIVVDRSITPTLYARRSTNYGTLLLGTELRGVRLADLEVVLTGPLLRFPPLESTPEAVQG